MATPATVNPFNHYVGLDGLPLDGGFLYFGEPFQDPQLVPLPAFWDDANTQPAAQPIRTVAGYPARNGAPAMVFVAAQYSMRVRDRSGRQVFYAQNVTAVDLGGGGLDVVTASGGQTIVTLTDAIYTPGSNAIDVYLNGLRLITGVDYFETGTGQITMATALTAGDQIIAFARSTFGLTQAVLSDWQAQMFNGAGGASQNFVLSRSPGSIANMDVSVTIGGIGSTLRPLLDYTLSGSTVTLTPAPAVATNNVLIRYGRSLPQDALRGDLASTASASDGDALVGVKSALTGGTARTQHDKNADVVSIKDFGAIGTAVPANVTADAAAFATCFATANVVRVPAGTYYVNNNTAGITIGPGKSLIGDGEGKTTIIYTGTGNGIYMGAPGNVTLAYYPVLRGVTLLCTNRASTVNGVYLDNAVHFTVDDVTCIGSGNPNSGTPADWVLYGAGVVITNNSIIGRLNHVNCRIWNIGKYYKTLAGSASYWSAAIEDSGHGECANNMIGIRVGDPAVAFASGANVNFHDLTFQGNYSLGMDLNAGDNTTVGYCYFEGNALHDITVGGAAALPGRVRIHSNRMGGGDIGANNYGTAPANAHLDIISVITGTQTHMYENDCSSAAAIPLIRVAAAAADTSIENNRLGSAIAVTGRIANLSSTTVTRNNTPEAPTVAIGSITRTLSSATANVSYTGVGFRPTSIEFFGAVDTTVEYCIGGCDASSGLQNRCMTSDAAAAHTSSSDCIRIIRSSAGNEQKATLASFDADGFTLAWVLVGAPPGNTLVVNYIARRYN